MTTCPDDFDSYKCQHDEQCDKCFMIDHLKECSGCEHYDHPTDLQQAFDEYHRAIEDWAKVAHQVIDSFEAPSVEDWRELARIKEINERHYEQ